MFKQPTVTQNPWSGAVVALAYGVCRAAAAAAAAIAGFRSHRSSPRFCRHSMVKEGEGREPFV